MKRALPALTLQGETAKLLAVRFVPWCETREDLGFWRLFIREPTLRGRHPRPMDCGPGAAQSVGEE